MWELILQGGVVTGVGAVVALVFRVLLRANSDQRSAYLDQRAATEQERARSDLYAARDLERARAYETLALQLSGLTAQVAAGHPSRRSSGTS